MIPKCVRSSINCSVVKYWMPVNPISVAASMFSAISSINMELAGFVPVEEGLYFPQATYNYGLAHMEELVKNLPIPKEKDEFNMDSFKGLLDTLGISFQVSEKYSNWAGPGNPLKGGFDGNSRAEH